MNRRGFITGLAGMFATGTAAAVLPSGIIMPLRRIIVAPERAVGFDVGGDDRVHIIVHNDGRIVQQIEITSDMQRLLDERMAILIGMIKAGIKR